MKVVKLVFAVTLTGIALACNASDSIAQQVTGVLGSPEDTTTIDGKQLPPPVLRFRNSCF